MPGRHFKGKIKDPAESGSHEEAAEKNAERRRGKARRGLSGHVEEARLRPPREEKLEAFIDERRKGGEPSEKSRDEERGEARIGIFLEEQHGEEADQKGAGQGLLIRRE